MGRLVYINPPKQNDAQLKKHVLSNRELRKLVYLHRYTVTLLELKIKTRPTHSYAKKQISRSRRL